MSGNDDRRYNDPPAAIPYRRDGGLKRKQAIVIVTIVIILSAAGSWFLFSPIGDYEEEVIPQVPSPESYVIITGAFDSVDVYSYWELEGTYGYRLHAHAKENGTYEVRDPLRDGSDGINYHIAFSRIAVCITYNGTYTEYRMRLASQEVYNLTFGNVDFQFHIVVG